jgi:Ca2+-binding RTX toxin-like protein
VIVNLLNNTAYYGEAQGDTFSSIENVTGSQYGDNLYGNDGANSIRGLDGIDLLYGYGGNDTLDGGNGNDRLDGGTGIDTMIGGFGDDTYYVDSASDAVEDGAGQGNEWLWASTSYTLSAAAEIELMTTTDQNSTAPINLSGNDFNQLISGNEGSNVIQGLGGDDNLSGRGGFDRLFGGDGNDLLDGGNGPDDLIGGAGADTFLYYEVRETGIAAGAWDVIHDFNRAEGDVINVGQMDSDPLAPGTQHWTFTGTATLTAPGQIGTGSDGVDTFIFFNTDTDSAPEGTIRVIGLHSVDASWFM